MYFILIAEEVRTRAAGKLPLLPPPVQPGTELHRLQKETIESISIHRAIPTAPFLCCLSIILLAILFQVPIHLSFEKLSLQEASFVSSPFTMLKILMSPFPSLPTPTTSPGPYTICYGNSFPLSILSKPIMIVNTSLYSLP